MASIPLHCNICPKQPVFSDISHLLTHVGSKGHLSHYFKAQVRGGQDPATRTQLDIYDRWYTDNQIEKLLSQRMILKDSKRPNGTRRVTNRPKSASQKPLKLSRLANKKETAAKPEQLSHKEDPDNVIDPRLSIGPSAFAQQVATSQPSPSPSSPGLDITSVYRAPVPRMHTFYTSNSRPASPTEFHDRLLATSTNYAAPDGQGGGSETESDQAYVDGRDPVKPSYPELPMTGSLRTSIQHEVEVPPFRPAPKGRLKRVQSTKEDEVAWEEDFVPKTPELKGICYPGMALFDSASPDAQRKRNQRKNDSLIAQIEQDSLEIECNEYIYWPDGSLKMCRYITGDVQSTPLKESTPPPPPPKRRRGRKPKGGDGVTNDKKAQLAKDSRISTEEGLHTVKREMSLSKTVGWPDQPPTMHDESFGAFSLTSTITRTEAEEDGWLLNMGEPFLKFPRFDPMSFQEDVDTSGHAGDPIKPMSNPLQSASRQHNPANSGYAHAGQNWVDESVTDSTTYFDAQPKHLSGSTSNTTTRASKACTAQDGPATCSVIRDEKENMLPEWDYTKRSHERSTPTARGSSSHRYTMARGDQKAQVSFTLPAEMAFAGLPTPPVYRISLNPLNPNAHLRQSLPYSNNYTPFDAPGFPGHSSHEDTTGHNRRDPDLAAQLHTDSDEERFTY
ncbi:MAG: hypothetical protein Q9216_000418 [Gyalolechia sp. 2 TL-2023]